MADISKLVGRVLARSQGLKRRIAGFLATLAALAAAVPGLQGAAPVLSQAAGAVGAVGLGHAALEKSLGTAKLGTLSSVLSALLLVAPSIPQLAAIAPILQLLAAVFGSMALVPAKK